MRSSWGDYDKGGGREKSEGKLDKENLEYETASN